MRCRICQEVESKPAHLAFKAWKRTVPSSNLPMNSVTMKSDDPLPTSMHDSLNNVAKFYSRVMSKHPIPEWNANNVPHPPPPLTPLDKKVADTVASDGPRAACGRLDDPISLYEVMRACKGLGGATAPGPDDVPSMFLKKAPAVVHRILARLFTVSWKFAFKSRKWWWEQEAALLWPWLDVPSQPCTFPGLLFSTNSVFCPRRAANSCAPRLPWSS